MKLLARHILVALPLAVLLILSLVPPEPSGPLEGWTLQTRAEAAPSDPTAAPFLPGEVLVKLRGEAMESLSSLSLGFPVALEESVAGLGVLRLGVPPGRELEAVQRLQENPLVEWAEPNHLRSAMQIPNDRLYRQFQWNMRKIHAEEAWNVTTGGPDVIVAVLDTGIDATHPDLEGKLVDGYDMLNDDPHPTDDSGHGTHKAGVVGAASNNGLGVAGVAWGSRIMPIKVLNSSGVGPDSVIARGITYAADHGARVINMSFGSSTTSQLLAQAVRYAHDRGALLVAAAGNTARLDNAVIYPAAFEQVLAVAATDESDKVADFSQHHPYVGVSAPGVKIVSTFWPGAGYGSYVSSSGTSDAAPHVSGLAALIWSLNPSLTNNQVRRIIEETTDDLGPAGKDPYYGTGRINAGKAVLAARPLSTATATPAAPPVATPTPIATRIPVPTPLAPVPAPAPAAIPRTVWYFAEGSTAPPFELWLLVQNPNATAATVKLTYMRRDGSRRTQDLWLPPVSRKSVFVNQVVPNAEVSMKVESDSLVFAERAMYFRRDGHGSVGVAAPSTMWYMAEGNTQGDFDTWILLQNPQDRPANVTLTFLTSNGQRKEVALGVPPTSRRSVYVNELVPNVELSTVVTSDQPIIAERAMYFHETGGHGGVAASQLSREWYLAEGFAEDGRDSWLLVLNPAEAAANLKLTYMGEDGATSVGYYAVRPASRLSIFLNEAMPPGGAGVRVESDQPVVVERSTYFADGRGGQNVVGTSMLAQEWYLPEGSTRPPFTETIAVLNPSDQAANLAVTFMKSDEVAEVKYFSVKPTSRLTLNVNELVPGCDVSTKVVSDVPVAVERSMYFADGLGGTSSFGIPR